MTTEDFSTKVFDYIAAGFPGLWIESYEHPDACREIRDLCDDNGWLYHQWDCINGLFRAGTDELGSPELQRLIVVEEKRTMRTAGGESRTVTVEKLAPRTEDSQPLLTDFGRVVSLISQLNINEKDNPLIDDQGYPVYGVLVALNIHGFVGAMGIRQLLSNELWKAKGARQVLIGLTHTQQIPEEIEKMFQVLEHPLPDRDQLATIAHEVGEDEGDLPEDEEDFERLVDAAAGLTRMEAEGAYSLSLARENKILSRPVFELKANMLQKGTGALSLYQGEETFEQVGGLDHLKTFCRETLGHRESNPRFRPKGVMLMGVSGGGKSLFAKALGREVERPTLICDIGAVMGRYVGQSEENMRKMLRVADAMSPCILMIDEVEKALSGVGSSGGSDSGVKAGIFGSLLTWMNDHKSDVYMIVTCNDVTKLTTDNPEFARQGRFDGLFFVDFPNRQSKDQIWEIHLRSYAHLEEGETLADLEEDLPPDENMTGAEIEAICRLARLRRRSLVEIGEYMPTIADQAAETIEASRAWAHNRCWSADHTGLYDKAKRSKKPSSIQTVGGKPGTRRKVSRKRT